MGPASDGHWHRLRDTRSPGALGLVPALLDLRQTTGQHRAQFPSIKPGDNSISPVSQDLGAAGGQDA